MTEKVTVPVNPLIAFTVTCDVPAEFAVVVIAGADKVKSWTVTSTLTVLESVLGAVPVVPVTTTLNGAGPVEQVTDKRPVALTVAVHPAGCVEVTENATVPAKLLIAVVATWEVPAVFAVVVIAGAESEKSTTWKVIAGAEV